MGRALALALISLCALAGNAPAQAQDYPSRQIRIIVPIAAGGTGDIFARVLGAELQKRLGQTVFVDNRPGGSNNIGARACADVG